MDPGPVRHQRRPRRILGLVRHRPAAFTSWRPRTDAPSVRLSMGRNGRTTITSTDEVIFADSVDAVGPDTVEKMWLNIAR